MASADSKESKDSGSLFTLDLFLAVALCAAHTYYSWTVWTNFDSPQELQALVWYLPLLASIAYGSMIYFGIAFMKERAPINPKNAMLIYNIYQSGINGFMAFWLVFSAYRAGFSIWGNYEDKTKAGFNIAFGMWMHYNNKYLELFDTFFMIVKKKSEQISFLHVYHHILLVWSWFLCITFCIGGDAYFGAAFNSLVHFFMYGYYALALFQIPCPWKKHLTMFQMIQFVFCASQSIYVFFKGNVWWFVPALQLFVMINMLYLFGKFYSKKYTKKPSKETKKPDAKPATTTEFEFVCPPELSPSPAPTFSTALVNESAADAAKAESRASNGKSKQSAAAAVEPTEEEEEVEVAAPVKKPASTKKRSKKAE